MKIAWFTHRYAPCLGGAETYGRAMVGRYVREGHDADVFTSDARDLWYFTDPRRQRLDEPAEAVVEGARVRRFAVRHRPLQRYVGKLLGYAPHWPTRCRRASYMPLLPGIDRVRGDYDAVFAVGFPYTIFSFAALQTARAAGAPLVLTPFLHLATPGDPVNRTYTRPHQIRLLREADLVVVVTSLEADAVAGWGIPRSKILRLPMAYEPAEVIGGDGAGFRSRRGIPTGATAIGHLATLDPNKGTVDLVNAVGLINARRPAADPVRLVLAGVSSPEFERFADGLPVEWSRWIVRTGPLAPGEKPDFYAALDLFSMPSRTDSFGIVFLEAWANGLPVVAAAAGGVVEVVDHGATGLLVPFGRPERLAAALRSLVDDPAAAARLGAEGRARVDRDGSWDDRYATLAARTAAIVRGAGSAAGAA